MNTCVRSGSRATATRTLFTSGLSTLDSAGAREVSPGNSISSRRGRSFASARLPASSRPLPDSVIVVPALVCRDCTRSSDVARGNAASPGAETSRGCGRTAIGVLSIVIGDDDGSRSTRIVLRAL